MILGFIPDIFKVEEYFTIQGESMCEIIKELQEECPINCDFTVLEEKSPFELLYVGILSLNEGSEPKWTNKF